MELVGLRAHSRALDDTKDDARESCSARQIFDRRHPAVWVVAPVAELNACVARVELKAFVARITLAHRLQDFCQLGVVAEGLPIDSSRVDWARIPNRNCVQLPQVESDFLSPTKEGQIRTGGEQIAVTV